MIQANSGMYRVNESYLEACQKFQSSDSKVANEWESFDMALWPRGAGTSAAGSNPLEAYNCLKKSASKSENFDQQDDAKTTVYGLPAGDIMFEEDSLQLDNESEWSLDIE